MDKNPKLFMNPGDHEFETDITLRDLLATQAMSGMLASPKGDRFPNPRVIAVSAYQYADYMLRYRQEDAGAEPAERGRGDDQ